MRHLLHTFILCLSFLAAPIFAQQSIILQNMPQIPQSSFQNPAQRIWMKGYFSMPILAGISTNVSTGSLSLEQLGYNNGWDITTITSGELSAKDDFSAHVATTILGFGLRIKSSTFSLKISEQIAGQVTFSDQDFELLQDFYNQYYTIGPDYPLDPLALNFSQYRSYSLGYSYDFKRFSVGANVQYLQGITSIKVAGDNFGLLFDAATGGYTITGELAGFATGTETYSEGNFAGLKGGSGNNGIAFDFGAVFYLTPKIEISFSAANLGGITWKNNINHSVLLDESTVFEIGDFENIESDLEARLTNLLMPAENENTVAAYRTSLRQQYTLGGKYYFLPQTSVAAFVHRNRLYEKNKTGVSLVVNTQFRKIAGLSLAIAKYNEESFSLGAGFNVNLGFVQLYAIADNLTVLISPGKARRFQAKAGINLIFGKQLREETQRKALPPIAAVEKEDEKPISKEPIFVDTASVSIEIADKQDVTEVSIAEEEKEMPVDEQKIEIDSTVKKMAKTIPKPTLTEGYFGLDGAIMEINTSNLIPQTRISIFKIKSDEIEVLNYTKKVKEGRFATNLAINHAYKVLIFKKGYESLEMVLDTSRAFPEQWYTRQDFFLTPLPTAIAITPVISIAATKPVTTKNDIEEVVDMANEVVKDEVEIVAPSPSITTAAIENETKITYLSLVKSTSLRSGPKHTFKVLRRLRGNQEVELLEKTNQNWWKVKFNKEEGWVKASALK